MTVVRTDDSVRRSEFQVPQPTWVGTGLCCLPFTPRFPSTPTLGLQTQAQDCGAVLGASDGVLTQGSQAASRGPGPGVWRAQGDTSVSPAVPPMPRSRQKGRADSWEASTLLIAPRLAWTPAAPLPSSLHVHLLPASGPSCAVPSHWDTSPWLSAAGLPPGPSLGCLLPGSQAFSLVCAPLRGPCGPWAGFSQGTHHLSRPWGLARVRAWSPWPLFITALSSPDTPNVPRD